MLAFLARCCLLRTNRTSAPTHVKGLLCGVEVITGIRSSVTVNQTHSGVGRKSLKGGANRFYTDSACMKKKKRRMGGLEMLQRRAFHAARRNGVWKQRRTWRRRWWWRKTLKRSLFVVAVVRLFSCCCCLSARSVLRWELYVRAPQPQPSCKKPRAHTRGLRLFYGGSM